MATDSEQVISELCSVIDTMNTLVHTISGENAQFGAMAHEEEIADANERYRNAIGEI